MTAVTSTSDDATPEVTAEIPPRETSSERVFPTADAEVTSISILYPEGQGRWDQKCHETPLDIESQEKNESSSLIQPTSAEGLVNASELGKVLDENNLLTASCLHKSNTHHPTHAVTDATAGSSSSTELRKLPKTTSHQSVHNSSFSHQAIDTPFLDKLDQPSSDETSIGSSLINKTSSDEPINLAHKIDTPDLLSLNDRTDNSERKEDISPRHQEQHPSFLRLQNISRYMVPIYVQTSFGDGYSFSKFDKSDISANASPVIRHNQGITSIDNNQTLNNQPNHQVMNQSTHSEHPEQQSINQSIRINSKTKSTFPTIETVFFQPLVKYNQPTQLPCDTDCSQHQYGGIAHGSSSVHKTNAPSRATCSRYQDAAAWPGCSGFLSKHAKRDDNKEVAPASNTTHNTMLNTTPNTILSKYLCHEDIFSDDPGSKPAQHSSSLKETNVNVTTLCCDHSFKKSSRALDFGNDEKQRSGSSTTVCCPTKRKSNTELETLTYRGKNSRLQCSPVKIFHHQETTSTPEKGNVVMEGWCAGTSRFHGVNNTISPKSPENDGAVLNLSFKPEPLNLSKDYLQEKMFHKVHSSYTTSRNSDIFVITHEDVFRSSDRQFHHRSEWGRDMQISKDSELERDLRTKNLTFVPSTASKTSDTDNLSSDRTTQYFTPHFSATKLNPHTASFKDSFTSVENVRFTHHDSSHSTSQSDSSIDFQDSESGLESAEEDVWRPW